MAWYADGVRFRCRRSGVCCGGRGSVVRVTEREREAIARYLGMSRAEFDERHTRERHGQRVLRDHDERGDCEWLERGRDGATACRVNPAKPDQCRSYPFWPRKLQDREAWEAEGTKCAGIGRGAVIPAEEIDRRLGLDQFRRAVDRLLRELDAEVEALGARCFVSGNCCDFPSEGHRLFTSLAEAEIFARGVDLTGWDPASGLCPAWKGRRCTARQHRPLACRSYFCDPAVAESIPLITERYLDALKGLHTRHAVPWDYRDWIEHLARLSSADGDRPA